MRYILIVAIALTIQSSFAQSNVDSEAVKKQFDDAKALSRSNPTAALLEYDRLRPVIESMEDRELRLTLYFRIAESLIKLNRTDEGLEMVQTGFALARVMNHQQGLIAMLSARGHAYLRTKQYDLALQDFEEVQKIAERNSYIRPQMIALPGQALALQELGQLQQAFALASRAHKMATEFGENRLVGYTKQILAGVYYHLSEYDLARRYGEEAYEYAVEDGDYHYQYGILFLLARSHIGLENMESALGYLQQARVAAKKIDDDIGLADTLTLLGQVQFDSGALTESINMFNEALDIYTHYDNESKLAAFWIHAAPAFRATNQHVPLAEALQNVIDFLDQTSDLRRKTDATFQLALTLFEMDQTQKAFDLVTGAYNAHQSLFTKEVAQQSATMRTRFETKLTETQNELLVERTKLQQAQLDQEQNRRKWLVSLVLSLITILFVLGFLIYHLRRSNQKILSLARTDGLTGLANRRFTMEQIDKECKRADRYQMPLSIMMLDIDHFKRINDQHGHDIGDCILKGVGEVCREMLRSEDIVGRIGGEEFLFAFPHTKVEQATIIANRIQEKIRKQKVNGGTNNIQVSGSFGVTQHFPNVDTPETLLRRADQAMYQAKQQGRDRVIVVDSESSSGVRH